MQEVLASFSFSLIFILCGLFWKYNPPKKINALYGYRTRRSMANQTIWQYANKIGAFMFITLGLALFFCAVLVSIFFVYYPVAINMFMMFIGLAIGIYWCETKLNSQFDKNGNPKT